MRGESLDAVEVVETGLLGDRAYALLDRSSGHVVRAKRPNRWRGILDWDASFREPPTPGGDLPPVDIVPPDGGAPLGSDDPDRLECVTSEAFGQAVHLESVPPPAATFEYHRPDLEAVGRPGEITEHGTLPGTFFDSASVLVLTTTSLAHFESLVPGSRFDVARFRPNVLIEPNEGSGFVENEWVGGVLALGDRARLRVTAPCMRCVMVNLGQGELEPDRRILKSVFAHNDGNAGMKTEVEATGRVAVGDDVRFHPATE